MGGPGKALFMFSCTISLSKFSEILKISNLNRLLPSPPTVPPCGYLQSTKSQLSLEKKIKSFGQLDQFLQNFEVTLQNHTKNHDSHAQTRITSISQTKRGGRTILGSDSMGPRPI